MKTKLFFGLLLLTLIFTACDAEREKEITRPNVEPLSDDYWTAPEAADNEIEVFDHLGANGSVVSGPQRLATLHPDEGQTYQFIRTGVHDFQEAYPAEVNANLPVEEPVSESSEQVPQKIDPYRSNQPQ